MLCSNTDTRYNSCTLFHEKSDRYNMYWKVNIKRLLPGKILSNSHGGLNGV